MNWKTTVSGVVAALAVGLKAFGVDVPQGVVDGVIAISLFAIGFFAKDKDVTGVPQ